MKQESDNNKLEVIVDEILEDPELIDGMYDCNRKWKSDIISSIFQPVMKIQRSAN